MAATARVIWLCACVRYCRPRGGCLSVSLAFFVFHLKRMHILRVCRSNGYSVFDLHYLFNSLIMLLFTYYIRVWGVAACTKYLSQIDRLQERAFRFGYIQHVTSIQQVVKERDLRLWSSIVVNPSHPLQDLLSPRRSRALRSRSHP